MKDIYPQALYDRIAIYLLDSIGRISVPVTDAIEIKLSDSLAEMNLDSLSFIELIIGIENTFGVQFEDEMVSVAAFADIEALANYVALSARNVLGPCVTT
jgi:acyl carrier protein